VDIWLPPDYNPQKKYPVIYAQDGQMLFDPTTTWNNQSWDVDDVISNLSANDSIPEIIVIGIFNGDSKRLEEYLPEKVINRLSKEEKAFVYAKLREKCRTDNDFVPYSDNYLKFVVEELKPYIDANYATQKEKDSTVIMGSSAGGILAAYALLEYPQIFGSAICLSSHWIGIFQTENNPFPDQLIKYFDEKLPLISNNKLFMDVADTGLDILYQPTQKRIDQLVMKYNIPKENWKTVYQKNAEHSELSWNKRLPEALKFIFNK
jgi:enterochelin esterase-like enzyme